MKKLISLLVFLVLVANVFAITLDEIKPEMIDDLTEEEVSQIIQEYNYLSAQEQNTYQQKFDDWGVDNKNKLMNKVSNFERNMQQSNLKEQFQFYEGKINNNMGSFGGPDFLYPLKIKIYYLNSEDSVILEFTKEGLSISEDEVSDISIGIDDDFSNFDEIDFFSLLEESEVSANSFKGAFILNFFEKKMGKEIVKERTFTYKFAGFFAGIASAFVKDVEIG